MPLPITRKAIFSDIHGNIAALECIIDDMNKQDFDALYWLGDIFENSDENVNLKNNLACLDILVGLRETWKDRMVCMLGNRDMEIIVCRSAYNKVSSGLTSIHKELCSESQNREKRWEFLHSLPRVHTDENGIMFFHGSPRYPLMGYLVSQNIFSPDIALEFAMIHNMGFHGHTHIADVFHSRQVSVEKPQMEWFFPKKTEDDRKYFIGVGSVGEPRGEDAAYIYTILEEYEDKYCVKFKNFPIS